MSQTSGSLQEVSPDSQEFLLLIWDIQRCHIGDVTAVELLRGCGGRMAQSFRFNVQLILIPPPNDYLTSLRISSADVKTQVMAS